MKLALVILFLFIAVAVNEVYSLGQKDNGRGVDPWGGSGGSGGSKDPWGKSNGPTDHRCGTSFGRRRRRGIDKKNKEQTFYEYDRNSNRCISFKSSSMSPGSKGFHTQSDCEHTCVQRRG